LPMHTPPLMAFCEPFRVTHYRHSDACCATIGRALSSSPDFSGRRPSDAAVTETERTGCGWLKHVAKIDENRVCHNGLGLFQIERPELVPFRDDCQDVGVPGDVEGGLAPLHARQ